MNSLIAIAATRPRVVLSLLAMLLFAGTGAFLSMPREAMPTVPIPVVLVSVVLEGVSPADSERLLARPMEEKFQTLGGLKEMRATAFQGGASIVLEFDADEKTEDALNDVRAAMDTVRPLLPDQIREPLVKELDFTQRPVLTVSLAADLPERTLLKIARDLRDQVATLPAVLDAQVSGVREEQVEIIIDPLMAENYGLSQDELFRIASRSNRLVAAGNLESERGRFAVTVPGLFETVEDIYNLPVKSTLNAVVRLKDIAEIRRTFKDRTTYVRVNGKPAVSVDVTRRADANVVAMSEAVRGIVEQARKAWPSRIAVSYPVDDSGPILERVSSLVNGVIASIIIVVAFCMAFLGIRSGLIVGVAIPGSFLTGLLAMSLYGVTLNVMALFGLILACGMLVDAAIVVVEAADKYMAEGHSPQEAYVKASQRMAWPIITSTLTTIAAFVPLLMWPGLTGKFFSYLPISVICVLTASLLMALFFVPAIGARLSARRPQPTTPITSAPAANSSKAAEQARLSALAEDVALRRDQRSFRELLAHYAPRLKTYFLRQGASDTQAERLVSQSLTDAWRNAATYDAQRQTASSWLFRWARELRAAASGHARRPEPDPTDPAFVSGLVVAKQTAESRAAVTAQVQGTATPAGLSSAYGATLAYALRHAGKVVLASIIILVTVVIAYVNSGSGIVFFPPQEPDRAIVMIHARGNLAIEEQDQLMREVEKRVLAVADLEAVYTRSGRVAGSSESAADLIGQLSIRLKPWDTRRSADDIVIDLQTRLAELPGIETIIERVGSGPPRGGAAIQMELTAADATQLPQAVETLRAAMERMGGFINVEDSRPLPGIEWQLRVNREEAAKYGADIALIGQSVQLITNGARLGTYRPDDSTEEIDIIVRYPQSNRSIRALDDVRVETARGLVPMSNFVERVPEQQAGEIRRVDAKRVMTVKADVASGKFPAAQVGRIKQWLATGDLGTGVSVRFKGEQQDSEESGGFLGQALLLALFLIAIVLLIEFDSFYAVFLVLSSVVLSTIGVFLGLLIFDQPFSVVMTGIGVITLAGIVVNNNIILIDAYNEISRKSFTAFDAAYRTGVNRLRPVLLTTITTIMGLLPMALGMNIDFIARTFTIGEPSNQWWRYLAQAIIYGLAFSTVLTLIVTPCALLMRERFRAWRLGLFSKRNDAASRGERVQIRPAQEAAE
ncbi:MAG: efflux RND transporter permease subunit [Rhodospirillaceae bacterium]|nr:efflux RND transporter permease subunit [Rhodospirillaceae bacterium]